MRTATRLLLAIFTLTITFAAVVTAAEIWDEDGDTSAPSGRRDTASTVGRLTMSPPIVQPGNAPASAGVAQASFDAQFASDQNVSLVILERKTPQGWRLVDSERPDRTGVARLTARTHRGRSALYRARALDNSGARGATTNEVDSGMWATVFQDDFDGETLDTSKWMYRQLGSYNENGSRVCSMSDERAVSVAEGTLKLRVMQDPDRVGEACYTEDGTFDYYLNGHVATEGIYDFKYGVAAARVKFPQGRGQHGAFWLQRDGSGLIPGDPRRSGAEIDVVEFFGDDYPGGGLASFLYYLNADGENEKVGGVWPKATKQLPPGDDWWRSYHVFSVEWTPKRYVFRVDGREIFRTREGVSGVEQFLILSLLSSDWELPHLDESTLPTTMETDWVRVWQRRGSGSS